MEVFLCLLLFPLVASSGQTLENVDLLSKRGLDHRSNLALLNNLNFENKPLPEVDTIPSPTPGIVNVGNSPDGTIPVTINTENLALGNPNPVPISNGLQFAYAPSFPQQLSSVNPQPIDNNIIYFTGDRAQAFATLPLVATAPNIQNPVNTIQNVVPQNLVEVPQGYPVQLIREIKVPQPYPVHVTRTIQVPVHIRVPVEVPKPYAVRVPHPVPVPVHIKVPVTVEKPYPVQITKTIAVPVEKPVYIKVPQPIQVPVPQPYPVAVPQPVQVQVPFIVRLPEVSGPVPEGLEGTGLPVPIPDEVPIAPVTPELNPIDGSKPIPPLVSTTVAPLSTTTPKIDVRISPVAGNGLLPPHPPSSSKTKSEGGLLNSYVSSKEGGTYRRGTDYQTYEYKKTW